MKKQRKKRIYRKDFGNAWAFTVASGEILNINSAVIFRYNDIEYALNGIATMRGDYEPLGIMWRDSPNRTFPNNSSKISISPFIEIGNKL